jgi:hypothetical protein
LQEELERMLDPEVFYRANRQFIINRFAITRKNSLTFKKKENAGLEGVGKKSCWRDITQINGSLVVTNSHHRSYLLCEVLVDPQYHPFPNTYPKSYHSFSNGL